MSRVAARLAVGDLEQRIPDAALEVGAAQVERQLELAALAVEVLEDLLDGRLVRREAGPQLGARRPGGAASPRSRVRRRAGAARRRGRARWWHTASSRSASRTPRVCTISMAAHDNMPPAVATGEGGRDGAAAGDGRGGLRRSHALRALRRAGHSAVVIDDLRAGRAAFAAGAELVRADVGRRRGAGRSCSGAAGPSTACSTSRPRSRWRTRWRGRSRSTETTSRPRSTLLEACVAAGVRAFVFSSSAAVYGNPARAPIPEDAPLAPRLAVRRQQEDGGAHARRRGGARTASATRRCATSTPRGADPAGGLGECHAPETHLIPLALRAAAGTGPPLRLFGSDWPTRDGSCERDFVHVSDLAEAHVRALEGLLAGGPSGAFNLGTGTGHSVREVLGRGGAQRRPPGAGRGGAAPARRPGGAGGRPEPLPARLRLDAAALRPRHDRRDGLGAASGSGPRAAD